MQARLPAGMPARRSLHDELFRLLRRTDPWRQAHTLPAKDHNMLDQALSMQAQRAYEAAVNSSSPDWRAVAELFLAAVSAGGKRAPKPSAAPKPRSSEI